jgi:Raf kinase inhibitor-like YbhB/YbcL family protein
VIYNIPGKILALDAGRTVKTLPPGTLEGLNDWKQTGWRGPCPPVGRHRYFHKLYALDTVLPDLGRARKAAVEKAMQGHILEQAVLVGTYRKRG